MLSDAELITLLALGAVTLAALFWAVFRLIRSVGSKTDTQASGQQLAEFEDEAAGSPLTDRSEASEPIRVSPVISGLERIEAALAGLVRDQDWAEFDTRLKLQRTVEVCLAELRDAGDTSPSTDALWAVMKKPGRLTCFYRSNAFVSLFGNARPDWNALQTALSAFLPVLGGLASENGTHILATELLSYVEPRLDDTLDIHHSDVAHWSDIPGIAQRVRACIHYGNTGEGLVVDIRRVGLVKDGKIMQTQVVSTFNTSEWG